MHFYYVESNNVQVPAFSGKAMICEHKILIDLNENDFLPSNINSITFIKREYITQHSFSEVYSEADDVFANFVSNNIIDSMYKVDYPDTCITHDIMVYEAKYADIWKKEMEDSVRKLSEILKDEDEADLEYLQSSWLEWVNEYLRFEHSILADKEYGMDLGSLFLASQRKAYKEAFRERTFRIKYIHYLLETQGENAKHPSECESLKMLLNEGD